MSNSGTLSAVQEAIVLVTVQQQCKLEVVFPLLKTDENCQLVINLYFHESFLS